MVSGRRKLLGSDEASMARDQLFAARRFQRLKAQRKASEMSVPSTATCSTGRPLPSGTAGHDTHGHKELGRLCVRRRKPRLAVVAGLSENVRRLCCRRKGTTVWSFLWKRCNFCPWRRWLSRSSFLRNGLSPKLEVIEASCGSVLLVKNVCLL